jgi:tRNA 2-selenouridine synthase
MPDLATPNARPCFSSLQLEQSDWSSSLRAFQHVLDVRSPLEYAEDRLPSAISCPVLSDNERSAVGALYKHDLLEARRLGASFVSANIASILQQAIFKEAKADSTFLVYCWRGGERSKSLAHVLHKIGYQTLS